MAINSPVSRKLKYLQNINEPQLTTVAQHPVATWSTGGTHDTTVYTRIEVI